MLFILTLIGLGISFMGWLGSMMTNNSMTAEDHRRAGNNLLYMAANDTNRSRIEKNYTQAMAHLRIADEMDKYNGRPTN
jgi:hypothetical protein